MNVTPFFSHAIRSDGLVTLGDVVGRFQIPGAVRQNELRHGGAAVVAAAVVIGHDESPLYPLRYHRQIIGASRTIGSSANVGPEDPGSRLAQKIGGTDYDTPR